MPTWKKLPWGTLALLLVTYSTLGWLLSPFYDPWFVWVMVVVGVLLLAAWLSSPWAKTANIFVRLFKSDTRTFLVIVLGAFLSVVIITWFDVFVHALVVVSAATLFKLEAQKTGLSERQTFWLLAILSLVGLGLGAALHSLIYTISVE